MGGLGVEPRLFGPANRRVDGGEVILDRLRGNGVAGGTCALEVGGRDLLNHRGRDDVGTGLAAPVDRVGGGLPRLAAFAQIELYVGAARRRRDEVELSPQRVELRLLLLVEDQLVERLVIAEVAHQVVEAGAEMPADIARVVRKVAAALGDVERVRKQRREPRECRLVALALGSGHLQIGIGRFAFGS